MRDSSWFGTENPEDTPKKARGWDDWDEAFEVVGGSLEDDEEVEQEVHEIEVSSPAEAEAGGLVAPQASSSELGSDQDDWEHGWGTRDWKPASSSAVFLEASEPDLKVGEEGPGPGRFERFAVGLVSFAVVAAVTIYLASKFDRSLFFANTTDNGGDTGAHVLVPWELARQVLPQHRLEGWSSAWYDGFPLLTFYFPLPSLLILLLNLVFNVVSGHLGAAIATGYAYNLAFKVVTVLGTLLLPAAAWTLGKAARAPRPVPECMAIATVPFLFETNYSIYGGNIASTLAGEFDYSLSLAFGVFFLAAVFSGLRTGRRRATAAVLFAACLLSHIVPALFAGVGALALIAFGVGEGGLDLKERLRWAWPTALVAVLLVSFWVLPLGVFRSFETNMGYSKATDYFSLLLPSSRLWAFGLAVLGFLASLVRRRRLGWMLGLLATAFAFGTVIDNPNFTALYNYRLVPLYVISVYLLAGVAVGEAGDLLGSLVRNKLAARAAKGATGGQPSPGVDGDLAGRAAAAKRLIAGAFFPTVILIGSLTAAQLVAWDGWAAAGVAPSYLPSWISWNYSGYQGKGESWVEYHTLVSLMGSLGKRYGCGDAMWEYAPELNDFGTTWALALLPYWTNNCIDSMEGLLTESSATTPYHFINQAELSSNPSEPEGGLPYGAVDVLLGVEHLQMLGVRYFMAFTPEVIQQANADPSLKLIAESGPWPTSVNGSIVYRTWHIYLVRGSAKVVPLRYEPVVMMGVTPGAKGWLDAAMSWYVDPMVFPVEYVAAGPPQWPRLPWQDKSPPLVREPADEVTHLVITNTKVSFDVTNPGVPVLVKISYFPDWRARGAEGPYRATPNTMVVVPTARHVVLYYGHSVAEIAGEGLSGAGIIGVVLLAYGDWKARRRRSKQGPEDGELVASLGPLARRFASPEGLSGPLARSL